MSAMTLLSDQDLSRFHAGTHSGLYHKLGAHPGKHEGEEGVYFAVWAPNAAQVGVMGDFNGWSRQSHLLSPRAHSGIWEGFFPGLRPGLLYKYHLVSRSRDYRVDKADPYAFYAEVPPKTASLVWSLDYQWRDDSWMRNRRNRESLNSPMAIYEVHLGSWMRPQEDPRQFYSYRELAPKLIRYMQRMGFTHVEFLPVMEHPFYGSWGYQTTGYYAPTGRYGTPQDFMYLIDSLHQNDIGVILDWVPSHFPNDEHGLGYFDGTHLYEHPDPRIGVHAEWNSFIFDLARHEVRSFLLSNAMFWLDQYHADGLRVDAVASMLYRDYSRKPGQWVPNRYGGKENLEAIDFLRDLNTRLYAANPHVATIAEESTAWPMVSRPVYVGGLGFGFKWDMGWMHDMLNYMADDPIYRKFHHGRLTFRMIYAFSENFVLPLSHDEVVYGKGSLLAKMPGDESQKFANLRLLLGYQYLQPGKKLLFMGGEFGQRREWNHDTSLDWHLAQSPPHEGLQRWVGDLNRVYRSEPALHELDCDPAGFQWIDCCDSDNSVVTFLRKGRQATAQILVACNFTPVPRLNYQVGVPYPGFWREILNSDAANYWGSNWGNLGGVQALASPAHGCDYSLSLTLPPLGMIVLKPDTTV